MTILLSLQAAILWVLAGIVTMGSLAVVRRERGSRVPPVHPLNVPRRTRDSLWIERAAVALAVFTFVLASAATTALGLFVLDPEPVTEEELTAIAFDVVDGLEGSDELSEDFGDSEAEVDRIRKVAASVTDTEIEVQRSGVTATADDGRHFQFTAVEGGVTLCLTLRRDTPDDEVTVSIPGAFGFC